MITVEINSIDRSDLIIWDSLTVTQNITSRVDNASFKYRKYGARAYSPMVGDEVSIFDDGVKIFGGSILQISEETESNVAGGLKYNIKCVDHTHTFDGILVSEVYENMTIKEIIDDLVLNFAPGFTSVNAQSDFFVKKIVFNQIKPSACLRRLSNIVSNEWYIDVDKDVHFFPKFTNAAPFVITDDPLNPDVGKYIYGSFRRLRDGSQVVNVCKVRGGEYDGEAITDTIEVVGNNTKIYELPYKFSNLSVLLNGVPQTIGIDFITDPTTVDVLYNYQEKALKWPAPLTNNDLIQYTGNPKVPVLAIAEDTESIITFGRKEKLVRDTSIEDLDTARRRAISELDINKEEIADIKFKTYTPGLQSGQEMTVNLPDRGIDQEGFIINRVQFKTYTCEEFEYNVSLVTTRRWGLIEYLRKINEGTQVQADDSEVAEQIITDIKKINVIEDCENVAAQIEEDEIVAITEAFVIDPLGANTEPIWVLGYYFPMPWPTDTKRQGRLDISLKVY